MNSASVIVGTYNPDRIKLLQTLASIIKQKNINIEIVISDDGSKVDYFNDIKRFMAKYRFYNYNLIKSPVNTGIVKNVYRGLSECHNEYVKLISPGDLFYDDHSLERWIDYMTKRKADISFCIPAYYTKIRSSYKIVTTNAMPQIISPYLEKNDEVDIDRIRRAYLIYRDQANGASFCAKKDIQIAYLKEFLDKNIYCEDLMYYLAVYDGTKIYRYPDIAIWYEYGTGVSSPVKKRDSISEQMDKDVLFVRRLLFNKSVNSDTRWKKKYHLYLRMYLLFDRIMEEHRRIKKYLQKILSIIIYPSVLLHPSYLIRGLNSETTPCKNLKTNFFNKTLEMAKL